MSSPHIVRNGRNPGCHITPISMIVIILSLLALSSCGFQNSIGSESSTLIKSDNQPSTNTPAGALGSLHMISATAGWAVSVDIAGTGSHAILRTTDGGQTWQSSVIKAHDLETPPVFVDALHGWVFATDDFPGLDPGSAYIGKEIALYHTSDGGKTWQSIASGPAPQYMPGTVLYTTHDGGETWTSTAVPFDVTNSEFIDMTHAWAWAGGRGTKNFYITSDGWQHWTQGYMNVPFQNVSGFNFISPNVGWALGNNVARHLPEPGGGLRKGDVIALLKTSDGGHIWQEIAHSIV